MQRFWFLVLIAAQFVLHGAWTTESRGENPRFFAAPTTQLDGWRSRRTIRNGPVLFGSVYRERVGNGWRPPPEYVSNNRLAFGNSVLQNAPQIITSLAPFFAPATAGNAATESDAAMSAAEAANSLPANAVLDTLVDHTVRLERHRRLNATMAGTRKILAVWKVEEIEPQNKETWGKLPKFPPNGGGKTPPDPPLSDVKRLTVRFDPSLAISDADVDQVMTEMTQLVNQAQTVSGPQKPIVFERKLPITKYKANSYEAIQVDYQLAELLSDNRDADVLVVRSLEYCNPDNTGESVIGCAASNQNAQIVVQWDENRPQFNAILWVHELCHNVDIGHVTNSPQRVMNNSLGNTNTQLIATETLALAGLTPEASAATSAAMSAATASFTPCCGHAAEAGPLAEQTMDYQALLQEKRVHGFSWKALRKRYSDSENAETEVAQIKAGLQQQNNNWSLETAFLLLCASGTKDGIKFCMNYVELNILDPDEDVQGHVRAALRSLGRVAGDAAADPDSSEVTPDTIIGFVNSLLPADAQEAPEREAIYEGGEQTKLSPKSLAARAVGNADTKKEIAVRATDTRLAGAIALAHAGSPTFQTYLNDLELREDNGLTGGQAAVSADEVNYKAALGDSLGKILSQATDQ